MSDNQQIIIEHIVNIDTVAQHIDTVDAVAAVSGQIAAVAGMLPDVAATAQARATIIALSKKLTEITAVSEALPLLHALQAMTEQVTAVIALRPELAAVVGQMSAIQSLAAELDTLMQAPAYAERSEVAAERAEVGATRAESFAGKADSARLGAEFAENEAKTARDTAVTAKGESETARDDARKAAAAAEAVSGLPDASLAVPGDPLIWNGSKFAVGALAESLVSMDGALGVAPAVLTSIDTAKTTADGAASVAAQAQADAATALTIAEGVDGKAGQALKDAAEAKASAEAAGALTESFEGRLTAAETETQNVGAALSAHAGTSDIHTPKADIEAMAESAANRLKDGGDGATLPADRDTLLKLSGIIDEVGSSLADFLGGEEPGKRMAILAELDRISAELSGLSTGGLTRADVVNSLDSDAQDAPLAAAQGPVLKQMVDNVRDLTQAALRPWVLVVQSIPETWPEAANPDGLLLRYTVADDKITNPEWYRSVQGKPTKLVTDASGIRLADGTTVQSAVGQIKIDADQASAAATSAAASAAQAQEDAATAKTVAEGVDAKATQAQTDAAAAKAEAANANTVAEGVDAKATQAQTDAAAAKAEAANAKTVAEGVDAKATQALEDAAEALAKSPDLATQTTPGIVKGSDTVEIGEDGSVNVVKGGAVVISPPAVTVPSTVAGGFPFDISLSAGPVLLPGAAVASFRVTVDGGTPVSVPAVDGAATLSHTPTGEPETTLTISVVAVDTMGNASARSTVQTVVADEVVKKPQILIPETGSYHFKNGILIATSPFSSTSGRHTASKYEIEDDEGNLVYSFENIGAQTTHTVDGQHFIPGKAYLIFVSHRGGSAVWSLRSDGIRISIRESVLIGGGTANGANTAGFLTTGIWPGGTWQNAVFDSGAVLTPPLHAVSGKGKILLGFAHGGTGGVSVSEDGVHFTAPQTIGTLRIGRDHIDVITWKGLGYGNGIFTACGEGGKTTWSADGRIWSTPVAVPGQDGYWNCGVYGKGRYITGGDGGKVASSPDMINWTTAITIPGMTQKIVRIVLVKDIFIAGSYDGKISTSVDGLVWSEAKQIPGAAVILGIASDGNTICVVSNNGMSCVSTDGITWTQHAMGTPYGMDLLFANDMFFAAGHSTGIIKSADGKTWTPVTPPEISRYYYMTFVI